MNRDEKLNKVYAGIIRGEKLTTDWLESCGFTDEEILDLVTEGILIKGEDNCYGLLKDNLLSYGKKLLEEANNCFKKCCEFGHSNMLVENDIIYAQVVNYLLTNDINMAFKVLKNYLSKIKKTEYEFLIVDLIKISVLEKDLSFIRPIVALINLNNNGFSLDISSYLKSFYVALANYEIEIASMYLDILSKYCALKNVSFKIDELRKALNSAEMTYFAYAMNGYSLEVEEKFYKTSDEKEKDSQSDLIKKMHDYLVKEHGIIILKPMGREDRKKIHEIVETYNDLASFSIGKNKRKQVVLRYRESPIDLIDVNEMIKKGTLAYKNGDYDTCIKNFLEILKYRDSNSYVYAELGLAYMKKGLIEKAITYLTVATDLSRKRKDGKFDYTLLVQKLKNIKDDETIDKDNIDFPKNTTNGIASDGYFNINEVTEAVLKSGLDVYSSLKNLNLEEEQIEVARLMYAREFYRQGNFEKGDQFVKAVEKCQNKTKFLRRLLEETKINKKLYKNRPKELESNLSLTLKP